MIWDRLFHYQPFAEPQQEPPPTDRIQLAVHAQRLIDDPVLALVLDKIETDLAAKWRNTPVGHTAQREAAYHLNCAVAELRSQLRVIAGDAKVLEAEQKLREAAERQRAA